jgi:hypothetical protein
MSHCQQQQQQQEIWSLWWFRWMQQHHLDEQNRQQEALSIYLWLRWKSFSANRPSRFCRIFFTGNCRRISRSRCCCCCCCSLADDDNVKHPYKVCTRTTTTSQWNNWSIRRHNNPCGATSMKQSFHFLTMALVLLLQLGDWKSWNSVTVITTTVVAAASANSNRFGEDDNYFSHRTTFLNQPPVGTSLVKGGQQIPFPESISSNNNSSSSSNNSTSTSTSTESTHNDFAIPTPRQGTIPSSRSTHQPSTTTTTRSDRFSMARPVKSSTAIPKNRSHHSPINYQYFARKHVNHKHASLQQPSQLDAIHFIIVGPNIDHWKEVSLMLASRGFNVMVCERVDIEEETEEGSSIQGTAHSDNRYHDHHHHRPLQQDAPELVLRIMGTSSH